MLRTNSGIIKTSRDGVGQFYLSLFILKNECLRTLKNAERPAGEPCRMFSRFNTETAGLDAVHLHQWVIKEFIKQPHGVRSAAHAGDKAVRQPAFELHDLFLSLAADDGLKVAHHQGERMGAEDRTEHIMRVRHVRDPVAHGLVYRVLESLAADIYRPDHRAEELHAEDVQ